MYIVCIRALEKRNKENVKLKNFYSDIAIIIIKVFLNKLVEIEEQQKHCREYQCALCDYKAGYKKEALNHMRVNHMEVDKEYFVVQEI